MPSEMDLNHLGNQWLEQKKQRMENLLQIALPDEALYREIMLSLGYPNNKRNFLELALITPYAQIQNLKSQTAIQNALLYRAGLSHNTNELPKEFDLSLKMHPSVWNYKHIRPANYPENRIKGIAHLLALSSPTGLVAFFLNQIKTQPLARNPKSALQNIMHFKGIGPQRKEEIFFNIILPFLLTYSKDPEIHHFLLTLFENYPPLAENSQIRKFKTRHPETPITNVKTYMGALFFQKTSEKEP